MDSKKTLIRKRNRGFTEIKEKKTEVEQLYLVETSSNQIENTIIFRDQENMIDYIKIHGEKNINRILLVELKEEIGVEIEISVKLVRLKVGQ